MNIKVMGESMSDHQIEVEVIAVNVEKTQCQRVGDRFTIGKRTPAGMCCKVFHALYPYTVALRFTEACRWEHGESAISMTCPDGHVVYRLTRVVKE